MTLTPAASNGPRLVTSSLMVVVWPAFTGFIENVLSIERSAARTWTVALSSFAGGSVSGSSAVTVMVFFTTAPAVPSSTLALNCRNTSSLFSTPTSSEGIDQIPFIGSHVPTSILCAGSLMILIAEKRSRSSSATTLVAVDGPKFTRVIV